MVFVMQVFSPMNQKRSLIFVIIPIFLLLQVSLAGVSDISLLLVSNPFGSRATVQQES